MFESKHHMASSLTTSERAAAILSDIKQIRLSSAVFPLVLQLRGGGGGGYLYFLLNSPSMASRKGEESAVNRAEDDDGP